MVRAKLLKTIRQTLFSAPDESEIGFFVVIGLGGSLLSVLCGGSPRTVLLSVLGVLLCSRVLGLFLSPIIAFFYALWNKTPPKRRKILRTFAVSFCVGSAFYGLFSFDWTSLQWYRPNVQGALWIFGMGAVMLLFLGPPTFLFRQIIKPLALRNGALAHIGGFLSLVAFCVSWWSFLVWAILKASQNPF